MGDQLRLGQHPQPHADASGACVTDDLLAKLVADVEAVLRGATAKLQAIRAHLDPASAAGPEPGGECAWRWDLLAAPTTGSVTRTRRHRCWISDLTPYEPAVQLSGIAV